MIVLSAGAVETLLSSSDKLDVQQEYKMDGHSKNQGELRAATLHTILCVLKAYSIRDRLAEKIPPNHCSASEEDTSHAIHEETAV
jgi:hypothetical protein